MRTIKFRGKHLYIREWVYGDLHLLCDKPHIHYAESKYPFAGNRAFVDLETIGQFTGLYDKNGNEIYEGDIFVIDKLDGIISWHPNGYWCLHTAQNDVSENTYISLGELIEYAIRERYDYKVIGNIYDNKELLTQN